MPHRGWVRAIRDALGMSASDLGRRMGVSQQSVASLEAAELRSAARLDTLERAAEAMDCVLVYALIPKTSLGEIVEAQAATKARRLLGTVSHHSALEDQAVTSAELDDQVNELAADLIDRRDLWKDESNGGETYGTAARR